MRELVNEVRGPHAQRPSAAGPQHAAAAGDTGPDGGRARAPHRARLLPAARPEGAAGGPGRHALRRRGGAQSCSFRRLLHGLLLDCKISVEFSWISCKTIIDIAGSQCTLQKLQN